MEASDSACHCGCEEFVKHTYLILLKGCKTCGHSMEQHQGRVVVLPSSVRQFCSNKKHSSHVMMKEIGRRTGLGDGFMGLSPDMLDFVLLFLDASSLCRLLQCSKSWFSVVSSRDQLWKSVFISMPWLSFDPAVDLAEKSSCCWRGRFVGKIQSVQERDLSHRILKKRCKDYFEDALVSTDLLCVADFPRLEGRIRGAELAAQCRMDALCVEAEDAKVEASEWEKHMGASAAGTSSSSSSANRMREAQSRARDADPAVARGQQCLQEFRRVMSQTQETVKQCRREAMQMFEEKVWEKIAPLRCDELQKQARVKELEERRQEAQNRENELMARLEECVRQERQDLDAAKAAFEAADTDAVLVQRRKDFEKLVSSVISTRYRVAFVLFMVIAFAGWGRVLAICMAGLYIYFIKSIPVAEAFCTYGLFVHPACARLTHRMKELGLERAQERLSRAEQNLARRKVQEGRLWFSQESSVAWSATSAIQMELNVAQRELSEATTLRTHMACEINSPFTRASQAVFQLDHALKRMMDVHINTEHTSNYGSILQRGFLAFATGGLSLLLDAADARQASKVGEKVNAAVEKARKQREQAKKKKE